MSLLRRSPLSPSESDSQPLGDLWPLGVVFEEPWPWSGVTWSFSPVFKHEVVTVSPHVVRWQVTRSPVFPVELTVCDDSVSH